jgi:hypothetical protein
MCQERAADAALFATNDIVRGYNEIVVGKWSLARKRHTTARE